MTIEKYQFQAEVGKILNIVANSLYSDKEIFIREYISNASDACDKLRYEKIKNPSLNKNSEPFKVTVNISKKLNTISFVDNGIGMSKDELIKSLGTIAKSGTEDFLKKLESEKNQEIEQIGKFGVGFYSGFMVTTKIIVKSKKAGSKDSWQWTSDGKGNFQIESCEMDKNGTSVTLHIDKNNKEFLEKIRVETIIKKYSDHITHPVFIKEDVTKKDEKPDTEQKVNDGSALWTKEKKDIKREEYDAFYNQVGLNYDKPWKIIHNKIEGTISYTNLLFIPTEKPFDLLNAEKSNSLKLYVKKVFITDQCENILPKYMRFVTGIIDSEDISLNISREMLQNDPVINKIRTSLVKKIISELKKEVLASKDSYIKFWEKFGPVLKEGIHEDYANKESLLEISLFQSSKENQWCSLSEYVNRMHKDQEEIYYISGDNKELLMKSPQMETFLEHDLEVLFFTDPVDEFWLPNVGEYMKKKFKSITKGSVDLKKFKNSNDKEKKQEDNTIDGLISFLKNHFGDKVKDVKISHRLKSSPVCFVADDNDMDIHLESLLKKHKHLDKVSSKVLEINVDHKIIKGLNSLDIKKSTNQKILKEVSDILLDQAKILEGIPLEDSRVFCDNINELLLKKFN